MTLNTVTLTWDITDLAEAGQRGILSVIPTAQLTDTTDSLLIAEVARVVNFTGGLGSLAGIIATDNGTLTPAGWAYQFTITTVTGQVLIGPFFAFLNFADGATQDLSSLAPVLDVAQMQAYMPLSGGQFLGAVAPAVVTLTDAATIAVPALAGNHFRVTLGGNRTLGTPSNPADGQKIVVEVIQDGTGSRTLAFSGAYAFLPGLPQNSITLTATPGARNFLGFSYNAVTSLWYCLAFI